MSAHTPGPWTVDPNPNGLPVVFAQAIGDIAHVRLPPDVTDPECDANAALISAAPDMAEALKEMIRTLVVSDGELQGAGYAAFEQARAALKKAGVLT